MNATHAFLAAFTLQVLVASILYPAWLIHYVRDWARDFGSERLAQVSPEADHARRVGRIVSIYRVVAVVMTLLGLMLFAWLFNDMDRPGWLVDARKAVALYFVLQMAQLIFLFLYASARHKKLDAELPEAKRTATLQRRGLFDFVSPYAVLFAVLSYFLFVGLEFYLDLHIYGNTAPSRESYMAIGNVTMLFAVFAAAIYKLLYGKKNPLVTHEGRLHRIAATLRVAVYLAIASVWFFALVETIRSLHLEAWQPFAFSAFIVVTSLMLLVSLSAPRRPETGEPLRHSA
ncbi:MAG TPA: hypothetical protein VFV88_03480 [Steroidobacteraceae bacterium]|jgi:hypothetical protein|nr:hypothetical protein [Steroidobacteraceae bacterium]